MKKRLLSLILPLLLFFASSVHGQVSITEKTSVVDPDATAVLDLSDSAKGLLLPRVASTSVVSSPQSGMIVFSVADNCMMYYSGTQWVSLCGSDPAAVPTGGGTLSGRTCFDVALNNSNATCGDLSARRSYSNQADFTLTSVNTQLYTFTPSGTISKVRFIYVETNGAGLIVQSLTPTSASYAAGLNISTACTATVVYKSSLNADAAFRDNASALKVDIYAIYNDAANGAGTDKAIKLTAVIKDCACCGAVTSSGGWLNFMCHNLGADENLDPFTFVTGNADGSGGTLGYLFQWGRRADGHEKRNSPSMSITIYDANGQPAGTNYGKFASFPDGDGVVLDWRKDMGTTPPWDNTLWGDGTHNEKMAKSVNDPCPQGWQIPTQKQWNSIYRGANFPYYGNATDATVNTWTWTGQGYKVGSALYLPASGVRYFDSTNTSVNGVGMRAGYWSSTMDITMPFYMFISSYEYGQGQGLGYSINPLAKHYTPNGFSIRCVSTQ